MEEKQLSWFDDEDKMQAPTYLLQLRSFVDTPGWKLITKVLHEQAQMRLNGLVTTPLKTVDGALEQEYIKGEAAQLLTLRGLPTVLIEELEVEVKRMKEEDARGSDDRDTSDDAGLVPRGFDF